MYIYRQSVKETVSKLKVNPETGLSPREASKRQAKYGTNTLDFKGTPLWRRLLEPFMDIFMVILVVALFLSAIQAEWIDAFIIGAIIILDAVIYYIQQFSTDRILKSLQRQTVQSIRVLRNRQEIDLDARELVPGDIVILTEGSRVPADGRIIEESGLLTNEAMLTGESEPVPKNANKLSGDKKVYEQRNMVFSGSFVVTGTSRMVVTATGNNTEYGRIASLASSAEQVSPIQDKINKLVIKIAIAVGVLAVVIFVLSIAQGISLLESLKVTLAMVVSAVPEGLPLAISIILALGAKRMAQKRALIKEMRAIESIGIVTCIASDKTGTLTTNHLSIQETWSLSAKTDINKYLELVTLPMILSTDALDIALHEYIDADKVPVRSYAFDQNIKMSGNLFAGNKLYLKGSPETIMSYCELSEAHREKIETAIEHAAEQGYKPIAIAETILDSELNELARLPKSTKMTFIGIIGVADTIRDAAVPAIAEARRAGVAVKMVTGDHSETAFAICKKLGLATSRSEILDCSTLGRISDDDLTNLVKTTTCFARVTPEDKFRILTAIKKTNVTAMTGDGVNDVPAIANAHIGIAMGDSPSIVQDAGDIVLLDNNFKNIIEAMKEGRIILSNIRRMLMYLLATNAGEAITMTMALALTGHHLLHPIQILWINLVTDSLMVIPIGLEPAEKQILNSKPEHKDAPILSSLLVTRMSLIAVSMAFTTLVTYLVATQYYGHDQSATLAFTALVVMQWSSALSIRSVYDHVWTRLKVFNGKFYLALASAIGLQILCMSTSFGREILHTVDVPMPALVITCLTAFLIPLIVIESHKAYVNFTSKKSLTRYI